VQEAKGQIPVDKEAKGLTYQLLQHGFTPSFKDSLPECKSLKNVGGDVMFDAMLCTG
jgi:hypothetical protein